MTTCSSFKQPSAKDVKPGVVLHNEDCTREWLLLSKESAKTWGRDGVYPALYFDRDNEGMGVNAVLFGQDVITLHISTQGLLRHRR